MCETSPVVVFHAAAYKHVPLLEAHGVDLVLSGHSHAYERSVLLDGHYGDSSTFSPVPRNLIGTPVTERIEIAAPPWRPV